jgi:hypothetical protein
MKMIKCSAARGVYASTNPAIIDVPADEARRLFYAHEAIPLEQSAEAPRDWTDSPTMVFSRALRKAREGKP